MLKNKILPTKFESLIGPLKWFMNRAASLPAGRDAPKGSGKGEAFKGRTVINRKRVISRVVHFHLGIKKDVIRWIPFGNREDTCPLLAMLTGKFLTDSISGGRGLKLQLGWVQAPVCDLAWQK